VRRQEELQVKAGEKAKGEVTIKIAFAFCLLKTKGEMTIKITFAFCLLPYER